jgi:dienelactone hydrolase
MPVAGQVEHPEFLITQEVSFRSEDSKIPAYLARPRESGRYPGVILIHDIFGVSDHARDVARRFANVGFVTLVPDCFARIDIGTGETLEDVRPRAAQLDDRLTVHDLENTWKTQRRSCGVCHTVAEKSERWASAWAGDRLCCSPVAATRWMQRSIVGAAE